MFKYIKYKYSNFSLILLIDYNNIYYFYNKKINILYIFKKMN